MGADKNLQLTDKGLPLGDSAWISRSPSVLASEVDGEIVIGSDIWKRIDPPCSFGELIDRLAADYDADRATIAADVGALLLSMAAQDVVRLT